MGGGGGCGCTTPHRPGEAQCKGAEEAWAKVATATLACRGELRRPTRTCPELRAPHGPFPQSLAHFHLPPGLPPCRQQPGKSQHGFDGLAGTEGEVPSFLYAMPLGGERVFLEETCVVARPALPFNTLKRRLERRCKALGMKARRAGWWLVPPVRRLASAGCGVVTLHHAEDPSTLGVLQC